MVLKEVRAFLRDVRDGQRNLAKGVPNPIERSISVDAISSGALYAFTDLEKDPATAGRLFYDAVFLTNNSAVTIEVVYSTGSHTVFSGQPFDLQLPQGTTQLGIRATGGAVNADEIEAIIKMRPNDRR